MKRLLTALLVLSACGPQIIDPEQPTGSSSQQLTSTNITVNVSATANDYELLVRWGDYPDEDRYVIFANDDQNPGPLLGSGAGGVGAEVGPGWREVTGQPANTTSYTAGAFRPTTFAVCAVDDDTDSDLIIECTGSARVAPRMPDPASIPEIQISNLGTDRLRVQ